MVCKRGHECGVHLSGKRKSCKVCAAEAKKRWEVKNRERFLAMHRERSRKYREKFPEKAKETKNKCKHSSQAKRNAVLRTELWRINNVERFKKQRREHYARNKDRLREYWRALYASDVEKHRARARDRHRRDNPGPQIRRLAKKLAGGGIEFDAALKEIREHFDRINGEGEKLRRVQCDGSGRDGQGFGGDGPDTSEFGESIKGV